MIARRAFILSVASLAVILTAAAVAWWDAARRRGVGGVGSARAVPLSEAVRPGGGWFAQVGATSRPVAPDTQFMDVPDHEERRIDDPGSPLHGRVNVSRVMETHITVYNSDKSLGLIDDEREHGRYVYWGQEKQDAYVYPDSTRERPHVLVYTVVERFKAERFTPEELRLQDEADARAVADALRQYRQADPALELRLSLAKGDRRFVGIMGEALLVPGAEDAADAVERLGVKVIPHTDDAISGPDEREFQGVAHDFAEAYNRLLLRQPHE